MSVASMSSPPAVGGGGWLETLLAEVTALLQLQLQTDKRAGEPPSMRDSGFSWLIGVFLAALASIISNLGLTLQKLTHQRIASGYDRSNRPYYEHALWMVGLSFVILASLADVVALCFAPQSLVAPLGALTMVSNVIFAPLLLHERIGMRDLVATTIILSGSVVAVVFGAHDDLIYRIEALFSLFWALPFGVYVALVACSIAGFLYFLGGLVEAEDRHRNGQGPELSITQRHWQRFAYPALAGTIGAQSVLFAKCSVELVLNTIRREGNLFLHYQSYLVFGCMFFTVFLQVRWLNEGLRRFDSSYIVPVFVSFWILLSVLSGMIFFSEYKGMTSVQMWLFCLGVALTIAGVIVLSFRPVTTGAHGRGTDLFDGMDENDEYSRGGEPYPPRRRLSQAERDDMEQQAALEATMAQRRAAGWGVSKIDQSEDLASVVSRVDVEEDENDRSDDEAEQRGLLPAPTSRK